MSIALLGTASLLVMGLALVLSATRRLWSFGGRLVLLFSTLLIFSSCPYFFIARQEDAPVEVRYTLTDIGTLKEGSLSWASSISNTGWVSGTSMVQDYRYERGFLWRDGVMTELAPLKGGKDSLAIAVNNAGRVVGVCGFKDGSGRATLWKKGVVTSLPTLGGNIGIAYDINNKGEIVGIASLASGRTHAFLYRNGNTEDLGTIDDGDSTAHAVNNKSEAVGTVTVQRFYHAAVFRHGKVEFLPGINGEEQAISRARDINDAGQIVGFTLAHDRAYAVLWENGKAYKLEGMGELDGTAASINKHGVVVGSILTKEFRSRAFVWQKGKMTDLNRLVDDNSGMVLTYATGINDSESIVGTGDIEGKQHAFLLTPIKR